MGSSISTDHFRRIVDRYLEDLRARCSEGHVRNVGRSFDRVVGACGEISLTELREFRAARQLATSNRSANMDIGAVQAALRWALEEGLIADNPAPKIRALPQRPEDLVKRRRSMTVPECERFIAAVIRQDVRRRLLSAGSRDQEGLWRTILEAGLRWREACMLDLSDVLDGAIVIRANVAKTGRERTIPVRRGLVDLIRRCVPFLAPQGGPWRGKDRSNARVAFLGILGHADIPQLDSRGRSLDIHALRRSCATRWYAAGVPIAMIAKLLGHAKVETTYRHYIDEDVDGAARELRERVWGNDGV